MKLSTLKTYSTYTSASLQLMVSRASTNAATSAVQTYEAEFVLSIMFNYTFIPVVKQEYGNMSKTKQNINNLIQQLTEHY